MSIFKIFKKQNKIDTPPGCYKIIVRPGGKVTDYLIHNHKAICRCQCGKEWEENDSFEDYGGRACEKCCKNI